MPRSTATLRSSVAFLLVLGLASACEPSRSTPSASKPIHCTVVVDGPKRYEGTNVISGRARFRCATPGAQPLTLKIRIEKASGEKWNTVATKSFTLKGKETVADELKYQERAVTIKCAEGSFRTIVDWTRTSRGDKEGDNLVSGSVRDPCKSLFG